LHGMNLNDPEITRKALATVVKTPKPAAKESDERLPLCCKCGVRQRPKILWFDESYNEAFYKYNTVMQKTSDCDVLLIVGTQLCTGGPSRMVQTASASGCIIIRVDPLVDLKDNTSAGMLHLQGKSGEILPRIVAQLKELKKEPLFAPLSQTPIASKPSTPPKAKNLPGALPKVVDASRRNSSKAALPIRSSSTPAGRKSLQGPLAKNSTTKGALVTAAAISLTSGKAGSGAPGSAPNSKPGSPAGRLEESRSASPPQVDNNAIGFFVYGTLRPDDDSGAAWTKAFCEGLDSEPALLPGASLYVDGRYPAVCLEQTRCSVRGVLLTPSSKDKANVLGLKLKEADRIEGYPDLYQRTVALVETASGQLKYAYVYHRTGRTDRKASERIADGDWMSRKKAGNTESNSNSTEIL